MWNPINYYEKFEGNCWREGKVYGDIGWRVGLNPMKAAFVHFKDAQVYWMKVVLVLMVVIMVLLFVFKWCCSMQ